MGDADVVEISELQLAALKKAAAAAKKKKAAPKKKAKQAKKTQAAKKEVIVIDEDYDSENDDDLMIIDEKDFLKKNVKEEVNDHPTVKKLKAFKRFDVASDHSDHHYSKEKDCIQPPSKAWTKKIQEEWRILEKDLPDTIYVRVYETRMDLLRAVILGADGTPYHDGAFFFDVFFPADYPNSPPRVYYHSGGLRLNPNLYANGYVCLSLLNTWEGNLNQRWRPGYSTMLQVLVSIQGLVLNAKPYFNEPGYEKSMGTASGEKTSYEYSEKIFLLSLKTMLYTVRRPPKNFEDLVVGHFFKHASYIMAACKAYGGGVRVGTLVENEAAKNVKGSKKCSASFLTKLPEHIDPLVKEFMKIGVEGCKNCSCIKKDEGDEEKGSSSKTTKRKRKSKS